MTPVLVFVAQHIGVLDLVARAGGGGSGGGGGGNGGGGGGGILVLLGYLPAHAAAKWARKHDFQTWFVYAVSIAAGSAPTIFIGMLEGRPGLLTLLVAAGAGLGIVAALNDVHARILRRVKGARKVIAVAEATDPAWRSEALDQRIAQVYQAFQRDWSHFDYESMRRYLAPRYYEHVVLMMKALAQMNRQNKVENPKLLQATIVEARDHTDNDHDKFTVYIKGQARDQLVYAATGEVIYTDNKPFTELWHFDREGDEWVLEGIEQTTADEAARSTSLERFAQANDMHYSIDWGWLLLPQRGQLFGRANFMNSNIDNHVIGEWQGLLVQLYTYTPYRAKSGAALYLVGQINVPKAYGGILIKRRGSRWPFMLAPRGYQKVTFEWADFNDRYAVYATDLDRVTSFELLNPAFMAELYDMGVPVDIEVVDNTVYFYTQDVSPLVSYEPMLRVLQRAHKELER